MANRSLVLLQTAARDGPLRASLFESAPSTTRPAASRRMSWPCTDSLVVSLIVSTSPQPYRRQADGLHSRSPQLCCSCNSSLRATGLSSSRHRLRTPVSPGLSRLRCAVADSATECSTADVHYTGRSYWLGVAITSKAFAPSASSLSNDPATGLQPLRCGSTRRYRGSVSPWWASPT